jgi:hypothetical protein
MKEKFIIIKQWFIEHGVKLFCFIAMILAFYQILMLMIVHGFSI